VYVGPLPSAWSGGARVSVSNLQTVSAGTVRNNASAFTSVKSQFGNLALNLAAAAGTIGLTALANRVGGPQTPFSAQFSTGAQLARAGEAASQSPEETRQQSAKNMGLLVLGGLGVTALVIGVVIFMRRK